MAEALKILARAVPFTPGTAVALYTVPTATQTVVSSLIIANTTSLAATYRLFALPVGGTANSSTALFYDVTVAASASAVLQVGITLATGQALWVSTATGNALTFTAFGQEIS